MEQAIRAAQKLKEGLAHHDLYGARSDDSPIYIIARGSNTLYELPYGEGDNSGQVTLSHLRDLLSFFSEQGYI